MKRKKRRKKKKYAINPEFIKFKKWIMGLLVAGAIMMQATFVFAQNDSIWQRSDSGIDETKITCICVLENSPNIIYAGGERCVYKSIDTGKSWNRVFILKGERKGINFISYDPLDTYKILVATSDGLYISPDAGKAWQRRFRGSDDAQRDIVSIAISEKNSKIILIGTKRGMFISKNGGRNWSADKTFINKEIKSVAVADDNFYVCAVDGAYYAKDAPVIWDRVYVVKASEEGSSDLNGDNGDFDEEDRSGKVNYLTIYNDKVYLATNYGVYILIQGERQWHSMTSEGLLINKVKSLFPAKNSLYAATDKGIFYYDKNAGRWRDYSAGLSTLKINFLALSEKSGYIFAATSRGIFRVKIAVVEKNTDFLKLEKSVINFDNEPSINEVQQAAIEYCEVSPEKIKWMRNAAKHKALLPEVSFGLDGDTGRTIDLDRGSTSIPDFYIEGPRDKNFGWDIDFSWDLGELIWNDDQTNIDVRSRLMVQLRNDIMDEVNKLYFERRRLQFELAENPPEAQSKKVLKELRLQELTANIDSLTGGYLSEHIKIQSNSDRF